jgi:hypothetical protein
MERFIKFRFHLIELNNNKNIEYQLGSDVKVFYHCILFKKSYINFR